MKLTRVFKIKDEEKGALLLEAVIALTILVIVLAALSVVVIVAVSNSTFIKNQNIANKYAQQAIELIRYQRDNNFSAFQGYKAASGLYCMGDNNVIVSAAGVGVCTVNLAGSFIREIEFDNTSPDCAITPPSGPGFIQLKATVTVRWSGSKCSTATIQSRYCHQARLVSCFGDKSTINF